jgi:dynein heavy chain
MPRLEAIVEQVDGDTIHKDFRLWLTSMPSHHFPVSILQNSAKMTNEPPSGVKMNLVGSYTPLTDDYLCRSAKPTEFKKLLFGLCFFHALVQDRRKFGPIGFNIRYEFTASDLRCSMLQLEAFLGKYAEVPFRVLEHLTGHINYGGRITDDWDRRLVMAMLGTFMTEGILRDGYQLAPGDAYTSPPAGMRADYLAAIGALPFNAHPAIFGLHENADIARALAETDDMCGTLLSLQARVAGGKGKSREAVLAETAKGVLDLNLKPFDLERVRARRRWTRAQRAARCATPSQTRARALPPSLPPSLLPLCGPPPARRWLASTRTRTASR